MTDYQGSALRAKEFLSNPSNVAGAWQDATDVVTTPRIAKMAGQYLSRATQTKYNRAPKALKAVGPSAVAAGLGMTALRAFGTPTENYRERLNFPVTPGMSNGLRAIEDVGVRGVGAMTDMAPSMLGALAPLWDGPEEMYRRKMFRDVQKGMPTKW